MERSDDDDSWLESAEKGSSLDEVKAPGDILHDPAAGSIVADIAREVVRIHAQYYGRGPTKARTIWRHDVVVVVLEEIFTKAEALLIEGGRFEQVRAHRQAFQDQVEPLFCNVVEQATGRSVRGFLSQVTEEGIASEVFVLEGKP